jgi:hypothetical protein
VSLSPSPVEFSSHRHFYKLSYSWFLGGSLHSPFSGRLVYLQFTWGVSLPPCPVEFSSLRHFWKLSRSWLLGGAATPAFSGRLVYLQFCEGFPLLSSWHSGCPALFAMSFLLLLLIIQVFFSFFPWVGVSLSRGLCYLAQCCLWEYHVPLSSPGGLRLSSQ